MAIGIIFGEPFMGFCYMDGLLAVIFKDLECCNCKLPLCETFYIFGGLLVHLMSFDSFSAWIPRWVVIIRNASHQLYS